MARGLNIFDVIEKGVNLIKKKPIIFSITFISLLLINIYFLYSKDAISFIDSINQAKIEEEKFNSALRDLIIYRDLDDYLFNGIILRLISILISAFIASIIIELLKENKTNFSRAIRNIVKKYPNMLTSMILFSLFLYSISFYIGTIMVYTSTHSIVLSIILIFSIFLIIFFLVKLIFFPYAIIIEDSGVFESFRRSWKITKNNLMKMVILVTLIFGILFTFDIIKTIFSNFILKDYYYFSFTIQSILPYLALIFYTILDSIFIILQYSFLFEAFKMIRRK